MNAALTLRGVRKRYGRRTALDGLDLEVPAGAIVGLVGDNGAGKTTTFSLCAGLTLPSDGSIDLLDDGPFDARTHAGRVALLPQDTELPGDSTPLGLLRIYALLQGLDAAQSDQQARALLARLNLADRMQSRIRTLSHGMRKRVMIAQAFLGAPTLLLLDEPLSGLDPREVAAMRGFIAAYRGRCTLLISSHNLAEIERICDRVVFLERGRCIRHDALETLTAKTAQLVFLTEPGPLPVDALSEALPDATFEANPETGRLACRFDAQHQAPADLNRRVVPLLLQHGVGLIAIERGHTLESVYLNHV